MPRSADRPSVTTTSPTYHHPYNQLQSPHVDSDTATIKPRSTSGGAAGGPNRHLAEDGVRPLYFAIRPQAILRSSVLLVMLQSMQPSWTVAMLNLSDFHDRAACDARPVAEGTCLMFPGHSQTSWTWAVNLISIGALVGSLICGRIADRFGRKAAFALNAGIMILGAGVQATAPTIAVFALGRFVAGIATGAATTLPSGYLNEISPPHLRNKLGVLYSVSIGIGFVIPIITFFIANTATGWRYLATVPVLLALAFLVGCRRWMVESPTWLLTCGRRDDAEREIARLFGSEHVLLALSWMDSHDSDVETELETTEPVMGPDSTSWQQLFTRPYLQQTLLAIALSVAQQLSGINAVFFYSSSMFKAAGLQDERIGSLIVNLVNLVPTIFAGSLGMRMGNRPLIVAGFALMLACALGYTLALCIESPALSVVFTAGYVASYALSVGPLIFVVAAAVFPDMLRASGMSIVVFVNWVGTLVIGVGYPYVAEALGKLGFLPFIVTLSVSFLYTLKFLPETAGKTSDEIQRAFRRDDDDEEEDEDEGDGDEQEE